MSNFEITPFGFFVLQVVVFAAAAFFMCVNASLVCLYFNAHRRWLFAANFAGIICGALAVAFMKSN